MSDPIRFAWDETKNQSNQRKHGVSFKEAQTVFFDEQALEFIDPEFFEGEHRFLMLGLSYRLRVLLVCHCYRESASIIRLISARKATKKERQIYGDGGR